MRLKEEKLSTERVYDGGFLHIRRDTVLLPNGKEGNREYVVHPGAVVIVALTEDNEVILEHQFRYPVGEILVEVPSGVLDKEDKSPLDAAKRELQEETGFEAMEWTPMGQLLPLAGYSAERTWLFLARNLQKKKQHLDEDEFINTFTLPLQEAVRMVLDGTITDGNTQLSLLKAKAIVDGLCKETE